MREQEGKGIGGEGTGGGDNRWEGTVGGGDRKSEGTGGGADRRGEGTGGGDNRGEGTGGGDNRGEGTGGGEGDYSCSQHGSHLFSLCIHTMGKCLCTSTLMNTISVSWM